MLQDWVLTSSAPNSCHGPFLWGLIRALLQVLTGEAFRNMT